MAYHSNHIAAYYRYLASKDTTVFGKWNMQDKAGYYQLDSNLKGT